MIDSHVTRAIHLVFNDSSDDRPFALRARDVRLSRALKVSKII